MMRHQLDDVRSRGESVAVLTASESIIYGRFGYGLASWNHEISVSTDHSAFLHPVADNGRFTMIDTVEAGKVLPGLHEKCRRQRPADNSRSAAWWDQHFVDYKEWRDGASARFHVVHESAAGEPDGYATYRIKQKHDGLADNELRVGDLRAVTPEVEAALWRFVFDVDLVGTVKAEIRPVDDQLPYLLADPRRVMTTSRWDMLWVRLVDLPAALEARRYISPVGTDLVLDVMDEFCPWNAGRHQLSVGNDGVATCRPAPDRQPELSLTATDLGAAYLGGVQFSTLARAGRVTELAPGALARADALFASYPQPWCTTGF
jgi:predicted acetyltransferase